MSSDDLLKAALGYAERGWPIFPCNSAKEPYTRNGVLDATTDKAQIEKWWATWPRANPALDVAGAGMMVLDLDPGYDPQELDKALGGLTETKLSQTTPRGGQHLFYEIAEDEIVAPSASKIAPKVDVRSFHSYVLLPPGRTRDGSYAWESEGRPAFRSDEMVRLANTAREKSQDRDIWLIEPDLPENVKAATDWLRTTARIAVEGQGGDAEAYATAAHLKSYGISQALAFDLMWEHWSPRCDPPWEPDEADHLEQKIANGYTYNTSPPGNITQAYQTAKRESLFQPIKEQELDAGREIISGRFRFVDREGMGHIRPPSWLIEDFLPAESYAMLFGAPDTFKTFLALDIGLSVATGACNFPWHGLWPKVREQGPVLMVAGEGRSQIVNRIAAWERMHWGGKKVDDMILADPVPLVSESFDPFIDGALSMSPGGYSLIIVDTVGRAMQGMNENSQESISRFTNLVEHLKAATGAAVLALHHSGHDEPDRERGSSVFKGDTDVRVRIDRIGSSHKVRLEMLKQKDADKWSQAKYAELKKVQLENGASSLVAVEAEPPKAQQPTGPSKKANGSTFPTSSQPAVDTMSEAFFGLLDTAVCEELEKNPLRAFSTRALAEAVAMRPEVEVSSERLRAKQLVQLREDNARTANRLYDPGTGRWRWR